MLRAPTPPREPDRATGVRARFEALFQRTRWAWRALPRSVVIALGVLGGLVAVGALAFGPAVRSRIAIEAERRKLDVEIGSVFPGFFAVSLHDLKVRPRGVSGIEARIDDARVELGVSLGLREVSLRGGGLFVEGEPEDVIERLREFRRTAEPSTSTRDQAARGPAIEAENLTLSWKVPSGGELTGSGLRASRDGTSIKLGCGKCTATDRRGAANAAWSVDLVAADVELGRDGQLRKMLASSVTVGLVRPTAARVATPAPPSTGVDVAPPPLPTHHKRTAKAAAAATQALPSEEPLVPLPNLHALRARIATAVAMLAARIPEGGTVEIRGLSAKLEMGAPAEVVSFGPGAFALTRHLDRIHLAFETASSDVAGDGSSAPSGPSEEARAARTPLAIDADLPVGSGDMTARLAGGPVSLAMLGITEGTKGLTDVSHGTVSGKGQLVLSAAADALTFDGKVTLRSISMKQPRIALDPLRGIDFSVAARGLLSDGGKLRLDDAELDMGALHVKTHGTVEETKEHLALALAVDVTPASCQALLDSSPQGLLPVVRSARIGGTFGATMNLAFDTRTIDKLALDYKVDDQCRMLEVPRELSRDHFADSFTYRTYHPDGTTGETTTGPGTTAWTNLDDISPFMVAAVLTTEDGAFYKHKGFNHAAIRSSVQANLKARRFVRGASTITMQLAKNLFLSRDKALARKIEELVLTDYLEQILRKDDMMELYLNVVEFGPDVYGITQAADYYFGRKPEELNVTECFFLASLLPSPIRYGKLREKGVISETWMHHLKSLMEIAGRNGKISSAELEEGLKQQVVFVRDGEPRPEPRKPVTSRAREGHDDDAPWRPLD